MNNTAAIVVSIKPQPVEITAGDFGTRFAEMNGDDQASVLLAFARETEKWGWAMQCRYLLDHLNEHERTTVARPLEILVDHLRDGARRTLTLRPFLTRDRMPDLDVSVIVAGGMAAWNGSQWISRMHGIADARPIEWPVLWWLPFPTDETALDPSERPQPPCGVPA